ncbi:unnamed protein product, partial [marine sediment metagenome]
MLCAYHPQLCNLYPLKIGKPVYLVSVQGEDTVLVNDLVLFFVEDPALVVGGAKEGKETDNQGDRILPYENAAQTFLSG